MENPNPVLFEVHQTVEYKPFVYNSDTIISSEDIFSTQPVCLLKKLIHFEDAIRKINDPEHPMSLEELGVVQLEHIEVNNEDKSVAIKYTPTIPHCSMATLIGLCIKIRLIQTIPREYWIDVKIREGSHVSEEAINKQLSDKERVSAALENPSLYNVVKLCLDGPPQPGIIHNAA